MPVPFGFSVGDFLAVSKLTWDVVHALRENAGSIQEVQAILEALMSFQRAISTCQTLALEWSQLSDGDVTLPERSLVNGVNHQLKLCHAKLERLATRIEQYTRSFMKQSGTRTARDQFVKLKWMFNKAEAESLQRDLVTHVQGLEAFISTLGIQVIMRTVKKFESYGVAMTSTGQKVTEIHKTLNTLHQELPKLLGYAWEGGFSAHDRPIILMDALGRTVPIPYLFCSSPTIFHDLLELMFRHLPGHGRVKKDEYNLVVQDSGGLIQTSEWSRMMSPGSIILMNIVVRISASPWELKRGPSIRCPRCNIFVEQRNATARCRRCYRDFGFFEKERILECAPKPVRPPPATLTSSSSSPVNPTRSRPSAVQSRADRAAELVHFQRIHFTRERLVHSWVTPVDLVDVHPSALHLAVESGLLPEVERVLEENVDLEVRDAHGSLFDSSELYGWTPLQRAAYLGHHSIVGSLVCAGSDVNALSHFADRTPLLAAVCSGVLAVIELLLQAGADVNVRSGYFGETALCAAVQLGNLEIVKLLLQARPDPNIHSGYLGETALHLAGQLENPVIVELLLESGADVNILSHGTTALFAAAGSGNLAIVELLLRAGADVNGPDYEGKTALSNAARSGNLAIVELLLRAGADVNTLSHGTTALFAAAGSGNLAIVELLLRAGADVNGPDYEGKTALSAAARSGNPAIVELLLRAGADVNAHDSLYGTALTSAVYSGDLAVVKLLLDAGADVNAYDSFYRTTLTSAVYLGDLAIVKLFLDAGADVNASPAYGETALSAAARWGNQDIVDLLLKPEYGLERLFEAGAEVDEIQNPK